MKKDKHSYLISIPTFQGLSPKTQYKELLEQQKAIERQMKALEEERQQAIKDIAVNQINVSYRKDHLGITDEEIEAAIHQILSHSKGVSVSISLGSLNLQGLDDIKADVDEHAIKGDAVDADLNQKSASLHPTPAPSQPIAQTSIDENTQTNTSFDNEIASAQTKQDNLNQPPPKSGPTSQPAPSQPISNAAQAVNSGAKVQVNETNEPVLSDIPTIENDPFADMGDNFIDMGDEIDDEYDDPDPEDGPIPIDPFSEQDYSHTHNDDSLRPLDDFKQEPVKAPSQPISAQKGKNISPPPPPKLNDIKPAGTHDHSAFQSHESGALQPNVSPSHSKKPSQN